jgi:hypothetical protein
MIREEKTMATQTRLSGHVPGYPARNWRTLARLVIFSLLLIAILGFGAAVMIHASTGSGNALQLDGVDDYVRIPNNSTLNPASVTVEVWAKVKVFTSTKSPGGFNQYIVFKRNTRSTGQFEGYTVFMGESIKRFAGCVSSAAGTMRCVNSLSDLHLGEWYHLALVADSAQISFYENGELQATNTTGFPLDLDTLPLYFGRTGESWDGYFNGQIDEVRIWNATLDQTTIRQWMHREVDGAHPNYGNLVGYWKLNDGSGQTVYDATTNHNDGTLGASSGSGSDDPTWVTSTAPINNLTTHRSDITAMWANRISTASDGFTTGLDIANVSFLNTTGDDIVFGHNNAAFATVTTSLPIGVDKRWARVWELAVTDLITSGGDVDLTFDISDAGGQGNFSTAGAYFLLKRDTGSSADFTTAPVVSSSVSGDQITFRVNVNNLGSEFTLGGNDFRIYLPLVLRN